MSSQPPVQPTCKSVSPERMVVSNFLQYQNKTLLVKRSLLTVKGVCFLVLVNLSSQATSSLSSNNMFMSVTTPVNGHQAGIIGIPLSSHMTLL